METIKRCPACGFENPPSEMMCEDCGTLLTNVQPSEKEKVVKMEGAEVQLQGTENNPGTVREGCGLAFHTEDGSLAFFCMNDEIIGRAYAGSDFLADKLTVSRSHCKIKRTTEGWIIEDLDSTNGTWLNGTRIKISPPLTSGDIVQLSQSCSLKVII